MSKRLINKEELILDTTIKGIFLMVSGLILPLILIIVVKFTGYSELVEEISKAIIVLFLILKFKTHRLQIIGAIVFGFLYGLSENLFYLNQIFQSGNLETFWERFILTVPMHILTVIIMVLISYSKKWLIIFGLLAALILHILFNGVLSPMLI